MQAPFQGVRRWFIFVGMSLIMTACGGPTTLAPALTSVVSPLASDTLRPPAATLLPDPPYPLPPPPTPQPPPYPPAALTETALAPTLTPSPTFDFGSLTLTVWPTQTPYPTPLPSPTYLPTLDAAQVPASLIDALRFERLGNAGRRPLTRIAGWGYGYRSTHYCEHGPYHWLDDDHLLLYPVTGQEFFEAAGVAEYTWPIVLDLSQEQAWAIPIPAPAQSCGLPLWSEFLNRLVVVIVDETLLFDSSGQIGARLAGGFDSVNSTVAFLAPSGRRLLVGKIWRDLETGEMVRFEERPAPSLSRPAWSADETRIFDCCFGYGDARSGHYVKFDLGLSIPGRGGPGPSEGNAIFGSRWVLNDTRVIPEQLLEAVGSSHFVTALIDPVAQVDTDIGLAAGFGDGTNCFLGPIAPDGQTMVLNCLLSPYNEARRILIELETGFTRTLPADYDAIVWSPDSQYLVLRHSSDGPAQPDPFLLADRRGNPITIAEDPIFGLTWAPQGARLAFLRADALALITADLNTAQVSQVTLTTAARQVVWNPAVGLVVTAKDGSLWWVPDPAVDHIELLTPPMPGVRDLKWSPSGTHLAFVSEADIYVIPVRP